MKEKILAAIKAKFPAINLSKKRLDQISAKIESKVLDDETKIDVALDQYNDFNPLADIAKQDDAHRTLEAKLKTAAQNPKEKDEPDPTVLDADTPTWAKTLLESNKKLAESVQKLEGEKRQATIKDTIAGKLKDIPASYWNKRALPENDEKLEDFITEVKSDYKTFAQELTDKGLAHIPLPGGGAPPAKKEAVSPEIKAFSEKQKAPEPAKV